MTTHGHEELCEGAQQLLDRTPEFVFTAAGPVHVLRDLGYLAFNYGVPQRMTSSVVGTMSVQTDADVEVLDAPERSRFEVRVDGELAGFAEYRRRPGLIAFTHTLIDPRFEGQGLASRLVQRALSETREAGLAVLPFCPFVRGYIAQHRAEYLDLVPTNMRDAFDLAANA